jgi:hypothetical protein
VIFRDVLTGALPFELPDRRIDLIESSATVFDCSREFELEIKHSDSVDVLPQIEILEHCGPETVVASIARTILSESASSAVEINANVLILEIDSLTHLMFRFSRVRRKQILLGMIFLTLCLLSVNYRLWNFSLPLKQILLGLIFLTLCLLSMNYRLWNFPLPLKQIRYRKAPRPNYANLASSRSTSLCLRPN